MGTPGKRQVTADILERILRLSDEGKTQVMISKEVGLSPVTVCRVLRKHDLRLYEQLAKSHAAERGRQLKLLHRMFRETWDEWERSKAPLIEHKASKPTVVFGAFGKPETIRAECTEKTRTGDPAYIDQLLKILAQQREVLMMNKVAKRDEKENPGAGDHDVTRALEELEALERKIRGEQPQTPGAAGGHDDIDDDDDPEADDPGPLRDRGGTETP
jgi:hypothetical protein